MSQNKKSLDECSEAELLAELIRRRSAGALRDMTAIEDAGEAFQVQGGEAFLEANLRERVAAQSDEPKLCPRCGRPCRVRVKNRSRTVRTTLGERTFERHYHYCDNCRDGFYPMDIDLGLPAEGEVTTKMCGRVLDFGVTETFADAAARWSVHHPQAISEHLVRSVVERAGKMMETACPKRMQEALLAPSEHPSALLVVQTDGSMLPLRGPDAWREAKVAVIYRAEHHLSGREVRRGCLTQARYVAVLGSQDEFRPAVEVALAAENADRACRVAWVGDGAAGNWSIAEDVCPRAQQILDWTHAVEHGIACGKALLGDDSPLLKTWERRIKQLLWDGDLSTLFVELQACNFGANKAGREAIDALLRYYRNNEHRMHYAAFREEGLPIGSGTVESAHRHVLQKRMKQAGQHWEPARARRMAMLRAGYKTAGPLRFHAAILAAAA